MNYLLDGLIILIVALTIFIYYRRGFVKTVLGVGKTLLSFVSAAIFGKSLGNVLAERYFNEKIVAMVYKAVIKHDPSGTDKIPDSLALLAEKCGVDVESIINSSELQNWQFNFASKAGLAISTAVSALLGYVLVFIVSYLILLIGSFVLESIVELPILRTINRLLGVCLGALCSVIFVFLFVFVVKVAIYLAASSDRSAIIEIIDKTHLFKFFSDLTLKDIVNVQ